MRTTLSTLAFAFFVTGTLNATIWHVGPSQTYTKPSQVAGLVNSGDTVDIDAGIYSSDVCAWTDNNLLIRCTNGMAHLKSNGMSYGDKAIWVIQGTNTTVEHIEFSLCTTTSSNGAGIRQEGQNLTVRHCYFHDNENGILSGALAGSRITVEYSEFGGNGAGDGYSHNLYIGHVDTLIFRYNYSHHAKTGHELKSRANVNYILYNRFSNEATGTASYEIDLPNGGLAVVMGNVVQQGLNTGNSTMVAYGMEGLTNSGTHNFYLVNNTLVNERSSGIFVNVKSGTNLYKGYNNLFAGTGTALSGSAIIVDTVANKKYTIAAAGFVNSALYDYHLAAGSTAQNAGVSAGVAGSGLSLTPAYEYAHPAARSTRNTTGAVDVGAYELPDPVSTFIETENTAQNTLIAYSAQGALSIRSGGEPVSAKIFSADGRLMYESTQAFSDTTLDVSQWPAGLYVLSAVSASGAPVARKFIVF